jgi:hypothetical protein
VPPATVLGDVTSASFTPGSAYCTSFHEYVGSAPPAVVSANTVLSASHPWPIEVTFVRSATAVNVTIQDFILWSPGFTQYCYGNLTGTFNTSTNVLSIPSQTLTRAIAIGSPSGTCTLNSGVNMVVSPAGLISATFP